MTKTMSDDPNTNFVFGLVQSYLRHRTAIVWGSGATIPYGMPSMEELRTEIGIKKKGNLEEILTSYSVKERKLCSNDIFKIVNKRDKGFRDSFSKRVKDTNCVKALINHFHNPHPQLVNIITTNYDCILEYILSYHDMPYSDGFTGREFSKFDRSNFRLTNHINLYKVHGSLRWSNNGYSYYNNNMNAIYPTKDKYEQAHLEPFRSIILAADEAIGKSSSFLCIGFGFNDMHITPKMEAAIRDSKPIVVIAKSATESTKEQLDKASKYILIEERGSNTRITYRKDNKVRDTELEGKFWQLGQFNTILGAY